MILRDGAFHSLYLGLLGGAEEEYKSKKLNEFWKMYRTLLSEYSIFQLKPE